MNYVVGFMFDWKMTQIALIRKLKPAWQKGKLNGIGGKIDQGERLVDAMVREFREETDYITSPESWAHFLKLSGETDEREPQPFTVDFFAVKGALECLGSPEEEQVEIIDLDTVLPLRADMIENLPWAINLAIDHLQDGRPFFVEAVY